MRVGKPMVLILCTGNSCRSQMAEGLLRKWQGDRFDVHSAGVEPKAEVHPLTVQVMEEVGLELRDHCPKSISVYLGRLPVRHIIIVCDEATMSCPRIWPGVYSRTLMPFNDPAESLGTDEEKLAAFRRVRDELNEAMKAWEPKADGRVP